MGRQGGVGDVGQLWERGEDQRSEVEGSKEETNVRGQEELIKREGVKDKRKA